tara:strand:+ start:2149 stop:3231 length:1083 start_codon:yes stop_codon:yes gene_type:complete
MIKEKLKLKIKKKGKISFSDYMETILFDKSFGVYENKQVLGEEGHFITSPLVSKYFSHCIAKNYIQVLEAEKLYNIVELGAGNADLAVNLILYLKDKKCLPKKYYFLDKSAHLISRQKIAIDNLNIKDSVEFVWTDKYEDLPKEAFVISNELFDCIPTDLIRYKDKCYQKAYINEEFKILWEEFDSFSDNTLTALSLPKKLPDNYVFEFSKGQNTIIDRINKIMHKAYFLIFDYGYSANELYINDRIEGTLTCIKNHLSDFDPLVDVGEKDISAFVNFSYLKNIFENYNWATEAFMSQANYLLSFDILKDIDINNIDELSSIKKLIMPNQMGEIFKVLIVGKNINETFNYNFIKNDIIKL